MTRFNDAYPLVDACLMPWLGMMTAWSLRWTALIAAVMAWFAVRRPRSAALRMLVLRLALLCGVALPVLPTFWGPTVTPARLQGWGQGVYASTATRSNAPANGSADFSRAASLPAFRRLPPDLDVPSPVRTATSVNAEPFPGPELLRWMRWTALVVLAIWIAGTLAGSVRLAVGVGWLTRLKQDAAAVGEEFATELECCRRQLDVKRRVELAMHRSVESPLFVGGRRPHVLVPTSWPRLSPTSRRAVLLHELAHAQRYDDYAKLGEEFVRVAFFFHPLVHWLLARVDADREELCDAAVVKQGLPARELARVLLEFCRNDATRRSAAAPRGATLPFFRRGDLKARIQLLLMEDHTMSWRTLRPTRLSVCTVTLVALGLFVIVGGWGVRAAEPTPEPAVQATAAGEKPGDAPPKDMLGELDAAKVIARIGPDEQILLGDVIAAVSKEFSQASRRVPREQHQKLLNSLIHQRLQKLIPGKVLLSEVRRTVPKEKLETALKQVEEIFDARVLPLILKNRNLDTADAFDAQLKAEGSSLEKCRQRFVETQLALQFLNAHAMVDEQVSRDDPQIASVAGRTSADVISLEEEPREIKERSRNERIKKAKEEFLKKLVEEYRPRIWTIFDEGETPTVPNRAGP